MQIHRPDLQIARLQACKAALLHRLLAVGPHQGCGRILPIRGVGDVHVPAQARNQRLPACQVDPKTADAPVRCPCRQRTFHHARLHHACQSRRRNHLRYHAAQLGLQGIALAALLGRLPQRLQPRRHPLQRLFSPAAQPVLLLLRAYHQHPLGPPSSPLRRGIGPRLLPCPGINDRDGDEFTGRFIQRLERLPLVGASQGCLDPAGDLVGCRGRAVGTQVATLAKHDLTARCQRRHLAITHHQDGGRSQRLDSGGVGRDIQAVISALPSDGLTADRQAQGVEAGQHSFELAQVGTMIFAMTKLQQTVGRDRVVIDADAGTVQAKRLGGQVVDADPALEEGSIQAGLGFGVSQHGQDIGEAVIGTIGVAQGDVQEGIDGLGAVSDPVADHDEAMVTFEQEMAEPDRDGGADRDTLPMAMWRDVLINQLADAHVLHDADEQRQAVDLFIGNGEFRVHPRSLPRSTGTAYVIYANDKSKLTTCSR